MPAARAGALLDCGDDAGAAQAALREGVEEIVFSGPDEVRERLADIARGRGSRVHRNRPPAALDLVDDFFAPPEALRRRVLAILRSDECRKPREMTVPAEKSRGNNAGTG